ncbi:hypothetical protein [Streptomyces sp. NPDC058268]|uniref:DUF6197 family protein n=1 Tax=Streptomyces sp. NPDC058268 TaxID=3346413 RepID=UPI0036E49852
MVSLSLTRSRVAALLGRTATDVLAHGWDPLRAPLAAAIDRSAGYWPGKGPTADEALTLAAWEALADYLRAEPHEWERQPGRSKTEVIEALYGARSRLNFLDTQAAGHVTELMKEAA